MPRLSSAAAAAAALLALSAAPSALAQTNATWTTCCGPADPVCVKWSSMVFSPAAPVAGSTMIVNGTGIVQGPVSSSTLSVGAVNAFLFGLNVFSAPINTCGETIIDVLDVTTGVLDALQCSVVAGQKVALGLVLPIPQEAQGLGTLNITVNATDSSGNLVAFCVDVVATI